jgi:hypothetical protein
MVTTADEPRRPDEAAPRPTRWRWLAPGFVLTTIVGMVLGGYVVFAMLAEPIGGPVGFPGVVTIQPLSGWEVAGRGSIEGRPFARVSRGSGTLDVVDWGQVGDPADLAAEYRDALGSQLAQLQVSNRLTPVTLENGSQGVEFGYVGVVRDTGGSIEGIVTTVVTPQGVGVVFDRWGPERMLAFVDGDIASMVDEAVIG